MGPANGHFSVTGHDLAISSIKKDGHFYLASNIIRK